MTLLQNTVTEPDGTAIDGWLDVAVIGSPFRSASQSEVLGPVKDRAFTGGFWSVELAPGLYEVTQRRRTGAFHSRWTVQVPATGTRWLADCLTAVPSTPTSVALRAITSTVVDGSGHLEISYSDGSTVDAGPVAGPPGPAGPQGVSGEVSNIDQFTAQINDPGTPVGGALRAALVARSEGFVVVTHNAVAATPRPTGAPAVYWIGTVEPTALEDQDFWWNPSAPAESYEPPTGTASRLLAAGESTVERLMATASNPSTSQGLRLTYLTAQRSEAVASLRIITAGTAAAATPTLCQVGVYEENADGSLAVAASSANNTSLFSAAQTIYTVPLTTPLAKVRGKRYAIGRLIVSASAMPSFRGVLDPGGLVNEWGTAPRLTAQWTGQTSLPAFVPVANLSNSSQFDYVALVPAG